MRIFWVTPIDVGRPREVITIPPRYTPLAERHYQIAVIRELVDEVQVVVDHPDVLVGIVGAHLDLVRPAPARHIEELAVLGPRLDHLAVAIHDEDAMFVAQSRGVFNQVSWLLHRTSLNTSTYTHLVSGGELLSEDIWTMA